MARVIVDGKAIWREIVENVKKEVEKLEASPTLGIVKIGKSPEMEVYIRNKVRTAEKCGIKVEIFELPENCTADELERTIEKFNGDPNITGFIVQLPLPPHIPRQVLDSIDPKKDVDCLTSENLGKVFKGMPLFLPCATGAMLEILHRFEVDVKGKNAVVLGASDLVGKPCAVTLLNEGATVTVCSKTTLNPEKFVREADIVVSGVGVPYLVKGDWIKQGAIVIDIGTTVVDGKIVVDVEFDKAKEKADIITPVPGGIGIITVAKLMENTLKAWKIQKNLEF